MKSIVALFVVLTSLNGFAVNRPEPPRPEVTRRASELPESLARKAEETSLTARDVLGAHRVGRDFQLELPKGLEANKTNRYERDLEEFNRHLNEKKEEFARDSYKATEVSSFLAELNKAYATRSNVQEFLENNRNLSNEQKQLVQKHLDFIDNLLTIQMTVLTVEGLSQGQVIRSIQPITRLPVARLKIEDFVESEAQITGILPKDYNMAKAARCVR